MTKWFTADTHYYHKNIIKFCDRPFAHIYEMNKKLIANHNDVVGDNDEVYFNGDFSWGSKGKTIEILKQLKGKKYMIFGNHDSCLAVQREWGLEVKPEIDPYVKWVKHYHQLTIQDKNAQRGKQMIVLMHYAMRVWNKSHWGTWHLYGHSHGSLPEDPEALSIDVGVDAVAKRYAINGVLNPEDYRPISYEEIKVIMQAKNFRSLDL